MKKTMTLASLLLMSAVLAAPASANYFSNSKWNTTLNIGSAKSPTPEMLRAIGDSKPLVAGNTAVIRGSAETDEDLLIDSNYDTKPHQQAFMDHATVQVFNNPKFAALEGKTVIGAKGERLGRILAVDQTNRLVQLQTPSGIAVAMPIGLVSNHGKTARAATTSKADVMAMAKHQTGRTVALNLGVKGNLRG